MKGKTHDLKHDLIFSAHSQSIVRVCHIIRSMFRVLGRYITLPPGCIRIANRNSVTKTRNKLFSTSESVLSYKRLEFCIAQGNVDNPRYIERLLNGYFFYYILKDKSPLVPLNGINSQYS